MAEKLVPVNRQRFETFLEQQKQQDWKGKHALTSEILGSPAVTTAEVGSDQSLPELFNKNEGAFFARKTVVHPHGTTRL